MTPERVSALVVRWVRLYTRGLPTPIAERRMDEIAADLYDHIADERRRGTRESRIARGILARMVRGLSADASWRTEYSPAYRSTVRLVVATALILLVPVVAMQFSADVVWTPTDFVFAGVLLLGTGLMYQAAARRAGSFTYRLAAGVALGAAFMLVWAVAAVGVIGEDGDRADLMYGGVLAIGIVGAIVARFRPDGMARTLLAMAIAQGLVAAIALIAGKHQAPMSSAVEIVGVNGFFAALFVGSASLFKRAASKQR